MFNFIQNLKKKFISFKKSYKLNIFYFKNKKTNFISSLSNYSRTNKTKTWTNSLIKLFSFKINSKTVLVYILNTIIIVLFIYFKKNAILSYFIDVFPYDLKLNLLTYQFLFSWTFELILNFWWILIFFINNNFINFIIFLDSNILNLANMSIKPYIFNFNNKKLNEKLQTNKQIKTKWADLSKKSYVYFDNKNNITKIKENNPSLIQNQYSNIRRIKSNLTNFYIINSNNNKFNFFNKVNVFLFKNNMFSKAFSVNTLSQKNLISNNYSKNKTLDAFVWYLNRNEIITIKNYQFFSNLKSFKKFKNLNINKNNTKIQLAKTTDFILFFNKIKFSKKISNFFSKK